MIQKQVMIDTEKCIGCGMCSKVCAAHNLKIKNKKATTIMGNCILCGQCSAICPKKTILMVGCGDGQIEKTGEFRLNPDGVLNTIRFRRSIRNFKKTERSKDKTNGILAAQNMEYVAEANGFGVLYSGYFTMAANASRKIKKQSAFQAGKRLL